MLIQKSFPIALLFASSALAHNVPPKKGADFRLSIHQSLFTAVSTMVREIFVHEISHMKLPDVSSTIPPLINIPRVPATQIDYSLKNIKVSGVRISSRSNVNLKNKIADFNIKDFGFQISADYILAVHKHPKLNSDGAISIGVKGAGIRSLITLGNNNQGGIKVDMEKTEISLQPLDVDFKGSKTGALVSPFIPLVDLVVRPILLSAMSVIVEKVVPPIFNTILANQLSIGLGLPNGEAWDVHTEVVGSPTIDPTAISVDIALKTKHTA